MDDQTEIANLSTFQDCLSTTLIQRLAPSTPKRKVKGRKNEIKPVNAAPSSDDDAADLGEFIEYIAQEIFASLSPELRTQSYAKIKDTPSLAEKYSLPLDASIIESAVRSLSPLTSDSLVTYNLIADPSELERFLEPILTNYITTATAAPPEHTPGIAASRPHGCEICEREQLPLTYHHLIPRQVHAKAVKRGWHAEWEVNKVAWLCRACHSYVHSVATNEELAKEYYDVDLLMEREDVRRFAAWVQKVRWKKR